MPGPDSEGLMTKARRSALESSAATTKGRKRSAGKRKPSTVSVDTDRSIDEGLQNLAGALAHGFPDQTQADMERTVYELVYAGLLSFLYYIEDEDKLDVSWARSVVELQYPVGWDSQKNTPAFDEATQSHSWIEYPNRHNWALYGLTEMVIVERRTGTYQVLFTQEDSDELERLPEKERRTQIKSLCDRPFVFGGEQGLPFVMDTQSRRLAGTLRLAVRPLFADFETRHAYFPAHFELRVNNNNDLSVLPIEDREALVRFLVRLFRKAIRERGGLVHLDTDDLDVSFRLRIAPDHWSNRNEIMQAVAASIADKGQIINFALDSHKSRAFRPGETPLHNDDFTEVKWYGGVTYDFALGAQSRAVKALWSEWEKGGLGSHQDTIRQKIGSRAERFRLRDVFRVEKEGKRMMHGAWGTMIIECGKGRFRLAPEKK